jgi:hypothetical protein
MEHIAALSGGLDSSVMYLYLTGYLCGGVRADVRGVFTDPGKEDPRTYAMLDVLEKMSGREIVRVRGPSWEAALEANAWFLPYHRARWCTREFKIKPFEAYIADREIVSHVGLRADEPERVGYLGDRGANIEPRYPLREMQMTRADVEREARRVGLPPTGEWSCGCCPFKPHFLQVQMVEQFPEMAEWMAWVEAEKEKRGAGGYTWVRGYTMRQLIDDATVREGIKRRWWAKHNSDAQLSLWDEADEDETPCLMCRVK